MSDDPALSLPEVSKVMRHSGVMVTQVYLEPRIEELFSKLQTFYTRPRPVPVPAPGYDVDDFKAVFGG